MPAASSPASTLSDVSEGVSGPRRKSRVSAEHTLNRVRENQRRHRARQRDHVVSLELKLAETEKQLAEARAEIATLKAERDVESAICRYSHITTSIFPMPSIGALGLGDCVIKAEESSISEAEDRFELLESPNCSTSTAAVPSEISIGIDDNLSPSNEVEQYTGPPPCCEDTPSTPAQGIPADPECSTCKTRPLPDPTESTTLCAQAFILISQQNFRNLDPGTIRAWLAQGLRRAQRQGEGCRVENGALLRLLDFISGV